MKKTRVNSYVTDFDGALYIPPPHLYSTLLIKLGILINVLKH